jgi:serine/threonine-protein kinase
MKPVASDRPLAGRYLLEELIATGGMAAVWRARDQVLDRTVAVKILRDDLARDEGLTERFHREAIAAARLTHPNIISVFDSGTEDGTRFIVMEHFLGRSFREVLDERGPLDPEEAIEVVLPVLDALGYAHQQGLVHRDIKPANILVGDDGWVKVTDFGIAKIAIEGSGLTTTGGLLGTVRYVSPEQVEGSALDGRADLFSVGVVLYEAITGRPPFEAETDVATAMIRLTKPPLPPRAIRPGIPRPIEAAVLRALAVRPEDRFPSAEAMRAALDRHAHGTSRGVTRALPVEPEGKSAGSVRRVSTFRSWLLVPLILVIIAAAAVAGGLAVGRLEIGGPLGVRPAPDSGSGSGSGQESGGKVVIAQVRDVDPQGHDGSEHPGETGLAIDGDASTWWSTDHYSSADFGNLKDGVGLWMGFEEKTKVSRVVIRTPTPGWSFQLRAGSLSGAVGARPIPSTDGDTTFTASSERTVVVLEPVSTPGILIWITRLAPDGRRFAAAISEVSVQRSTS